jgi:hypothetical protein
MELAKVEDKYLGLYLGYGSPKPYLPMVTLL